MKVLIDGKEVECLNDVKIIYENEPIVRSMGEAYGNLEVTLNSEGMIADTWFDGNVISSMWKTKEDIIEETH